MYNCRTHETLSSYDYLPSLTPDVQLYGCIVSDSMFIKSICSEILFFFHFTESTPIPDETRLRKYLFGSDHQTEDLTTTPITHRRQVMNVSFEIQIRKLIDLVKYHAVR